MGVALRAEARSRSARSSRPDLKLAPRRRRWPALVAGLLFTVLLAGMLGAAVFHTQLAERQFRIDRLENAVDAERERFDELRHRRATLRSPARLAEAAGAMGMVRGDASEFVPVDAMTLAKQLALAGPVDDDARQIIDQNDPLQQFRDVKSVSAGQP